jgi:hypothetical protein
VLTFALSVPNLCKPATVFDDGPPGLPNRHGVLAILSTTTSGLADERPSLIQLDFRRRDFLSMGFDRR